MAEKKSQANDYVHPWNRKSRFCKGCGQPSGFKDYCSPDCRAGDDETLIRDLKTLDMDGVPLITNWTPRQSKNSASRRSGAARSTPHPPKRA